MMLRIGASDTAFQCELGATKNPTLPAFNVKIEGFEQARKTTASTAFGNAASKSPSQRRPPASTQPKNNHPSNNRGKGEHDRRLALCGRCFCCAKDDHMLPQCSYPVDVKCNLCSSQGHITPACSRRNPTTTAFLCSSCFATTSFNLRQIFSRRRSFVLDFFSRCSLHCFRNVPGWSFLHASQ